MALKNAGNPLPKVSPSPMEMGVEENIQSRPPVTIPKKREEYTSLVIKASPMATTGGSSDQRELTGLVIGA